MDVDLQLPPEDIDTIVTILARGYLRCTDSQTPGSEECLDNTEDSSRHVTAVNASENDREQAATATEEEDR